MSNPYLKHSKFVQSKYQGDEYGGFFDDLARDVDDLARDVGGYASAAYEKAKGLASEGMQYFDKGVAYTSGTISSIQNQITGASSGSPVKKGSDGWATYFWDTAKKQVTYINPSSGQKVKVTPTQGNYKYLTTSGKIKWVDSTPSAMSQQKSQSAALVPMVSASSGIEDPFLMQPEGFMEKATTYAKENPMIVGGVALGAISLIAGAFMLRGSKSKYEWGQAPLGELAYYYGLFQNPETGQWDYVVEQEIVTDPTKGGYFGTQQAAHAQAQAQLATFNAPVRLGDPGLSTTPPDPDEFLM